ncbi:ATP-binding cassette domain-containing protein [Methanococcus voltae]|uniref:Molybdate/tungstate import ATP-binding protein WtpC n=1 Tax=Methanococcus voltae (strain ATCC BAA-1334 / A3) TaxID=456320 RepID=D7DUN0_METV3|nr:ATP-binding cassette domain-containing protein [Methanococcus voltae]MCS3900642.1 molybdate/tungstate transport system ATP-binding protein [Methanococcus voltae]
MLKLENVSKAWKEFQLRNVSFELNDKYCVILGPSGAGKSVIIQCIAGILDVDGGNIYYDGEDITELKPEYRNFGYVPQNYALFPNMNVYKNIKYGMTIRKIDKITADKKINDMAEFLNISHILERTPKTLSGGEQQRVALARALVLDPKLLLLDEPTSALDIHIKDTVMDELKKISEITPIIHITHDFVEARTLGENIAIVIDGELNDFGTKDIFKNPKNERVAKFLGYNIISENNSKLAVAPENVKIEKADMITNNINNNNNNNNLDNPISTKYGIVNGYIDFGYYKSVSISYNNDNLKCICDEDFEIKSGDNVSVNFENMINI